MNRIHIYLHSIEYRSKINKHNHGNFVVFVIIGFFEMKNVVNKKVEDVELEH